MTDFPERDRLVEEAREIEREAASLRERVNAGTLSRQRLDLAACCGHAAARKAALSLGLRGEFDPLGALVVPEPRYGWTRNDSAQWPFGAEAMFEIALIAIRSLQPEWTRLGDSGRIALTHLELVSRSLRLLTDAAKDRSLFTSELQSLSDEVGEQLADGSLSLNTQGGARIVPCVLYALDNLVNNLLFCPNGNWQFVDDAVAFVLCAGTETERVVRAAIVAELPIWALLPS